MSSSPAGAMDPTNPLKLVLCSFFKRGDCMKGVKCHFVHTDQVKPFPGHPWYPYFSYVKPPSHVHESPMDTKDVNVNKEILQNRLKLQSIKTLRFCKAYPACKHGRHCAFLHDQRIRMMMSALRPPYQTPPQITPQAIQPKPLSPNASPFSPRLSGASPNPSSIDPIDTPQGFAGTATKVSLPNLILSPVTSPVISPLTTPISSPLSGSLPMGRAAPKPQTQSIPPQSTAFSMPGSMFSLYSQVNQYNSVIDTPSPFEQHFQMACPLFSKKL